MLAPISLGLDFGTEAVRAVFVDRGGQVHGEAEVRYPHGQIIDTLPGRSDPLPPHYALQHPQDWIDSAAESVQAAGGSVDLSRVVGIGVDFTSCTMLPCRADGTPLCQVDQFAGVPLAWPKLWKHHGAIVETEEMNRVALERGEKLLQRYGGTIGLEWLHPKMLETIRQAPEVADAADVWIEAGDWFVWQLIGGKASSLPRSTCQAGYKGLRSFGDDDLTLDYLAAVDPKLAAASEHLLAACYIAPGQAAGTLRDEMATRLGLPAGLAVSAAIIDAHSAVPGVGAAGTGTLVMVMGTSSCHMLNDSRMAPVPGVAGVVYEGMLPGLYGYETGQAAVGDAFAWLSQLVGRDLADLTADAMALPAGSDGVVCLDWMNGCRTPLMDGSVRGAFAGLSLAHRPAHLYRAVLEGSACGLRWIVELLEQHGVAVDRLVATGGLPHHNPALVAIYASVLGRPIEVHPATQGPAIGAAVLGMVAAGPDASGLESIEQAAAAMASSEQSTVVRPNEADRATYDAVYRRYRMLADTQSGSR